MKTAQHITRTVLPSMEDLYTQLCMEKANRIIKDYNHPSHKLFCLLPPGRWSCSIQSHNTRLRDSFVSQAIRLFNSWAHMLFIPTLLHCTLLIHYLFISVYIQLRFYLYFYTSITTTHTCILSLLHNCLNSIISIFIFILVYISISILFCILLF